MTTFESRARLAWAQWGSYARHGACAQCRRTRDEHGVPLYLRGTSAARLICLECWDRGKR